MQQIFWKIYNWAPDQWPTYALAHQLFKLSEARDTLTGDIRLEGPLRLNTCLSNPVRSFDGRLMNDNDDIRRRIKSLLSCYALSYKTLRDRDVYPLNIYNKCVNVFYDSAFDYVDEYKEIMEESIGYPLKWPIKYRSDSFDFLLELITEKKIDSSEVHFIHLKSGTIDVTLLDSVMMLERAIANEIKSKGKKPELETEQRFLIYAIEKLREIGAKTVAELEEKSVVREFEEGQEVAKEVVV